MTQELYEPEEGRLQYRRVFRLLLVTCPISFVTPLFDYLGT